MANKHNLDRNIPAEVKRIVRKRCGFGCIICGIATVEYHHFDPEFSDAKQHDAGGIVLLCPTCHAKVDKGILNKNSITNANQNPKCLQEQFVKDIFYIGQNAIAFKLGSAHFKKVDVITYDGLPLISFTPSEEENGPLLLNATLYDKDSNHLLGIIDNEWSSGTNHFDIEATSNELIIREKKGDIKLRMSHVAESEIAITQLEMNYKGFVIKIESDNFLITTPKSGKMTLKCPNIYSTLKLFSDGSLKL